MIADDHQVIIDGLKSLVEGEEIEAIGEALTGQELMDKLSRNTPDVVLVDINMPQMDGIEASTMIRKKFPLVKIVILTMYDKPEFIRNLVSIGVNGYLLKNTGKTELLTAIRKVYAGEDYFSREVSKTLISSMKSSVFDQQVQLTKREKEVLKLIAKGLSTSEISEELFVSTHTVDTHRKNLLGKLQIKNTAGLVRFAFENGYVTNSFG